MKNKGHKTTNLLYKSFFIFLIVALGVATACQNQSRGFALPDGDIEAGKRAFTELNCTDCHSINNINWMGQENGDTLHIRLGGEITKIKTYGELVTSVINPSHKISRAFHKKQEMTFAEGRSKMELYSYNEVMTVQELVDIVTFLQSEYELVKPDVPYTYY